MIINYKTAQTAKYASPTADTFFYTGEGIVCNSLTGEMIGTSEPWDGENEWN